MKKIGFADYYISEWHANNYPAWMKEACEKLGAEYTLAYVWAEKRGKLEKRSVVLGEYNMMNDTFPVESGLSAEDYIAFPDPELCKEGAATTRTEPVAETVGESGVS